MKQVVAILMALTAATSAAKADSVTTGKITYGQVRITAVENSLITFLLASGKKIIKSLPEVKMVSVTDLPQLGEAEQLMKARKAAEAVAAYSKAEKTELPLGKSWLKLLLAHRKLVAAKKAGMILEATAAWLVIMDADNASKAAIKLSPAAGTTKSPANDRAIKLLKAKENSSNKAYASAANRLQIKLLNLQGRTDEARRLAAVQYPIDVEVPSARLRADPGGMMNARDTTAKAMSARRRAAARKWSKKESAITTDTGKTSRKIDLYAHGGSPGTSFYGSGGNAHHVVWVIDRSGSMMDSFELVKREIAKSVGQLKAIQDFHVILFSDGPAIEVETKRLVSATEKAKLKAVAFLRPRRALRQTDPIPALQRAFAVLKTADRKRPGKLIYLLTDGVFPDNRAVLQEIRKLNRQKEVHVNTFLYGNRPPVAVKVMKTIAKENGGQYKYVSGDR